MNHCSINLSSSRLNLPRSPLQSMKDDVVHMKNPTMSTKRKRTQGTENASNTKDYGENLVGLKAKIWWPKDRKFYECAIASYDPIKKKHKVLYADGEDELLNLKRERWSLVSDDDLVTDSDQDVEHSRHDSDDTSPDVQRKNKEKNNSKTSSKRQKVEKSPNSKLKEIFTKSGGKSKDDAKLPATEAKDNHSKSNGKPVDVVNKFGDHFQIISAICPGDSAKVSCKPNDVAAKTPSHSLQDCHITATFPDLEDQYEALEKFGKDLTELAKRGNLDHVGRGDEIQRCVQILSRRTKNNPMIIGELGVGGATAIAEGLAQRIVCGDVPEPLLERKLISLDMDSMLSGAKNRDDFEQMFKAVMKEATASNGQIILFIDEIHTIVGTGATGAGNLLKPIIGRGGLRCIGATTHNEHSKIIEKDPALECKFQQVFVDMLSVQDTISVLRGARERYELHHGVKISDNALVSAATLSDRYIIDRFLPDKAIDLVDEAATTFKMEMTMMTSTLELGDISRAVNKLEMDKSFLLNEKELVIEMESDLEALKQNQRNLYELLQKEKTNQVRSMKNKKSGKPSLEAEQVTDVDIAKVVSRWTGIPLSSIQLSERDKLVSLEGALSRRVIGQDTALKSVADAIRRSRAGLSNPNRPIASFMFMGPTGVGKTELAKALADYLFGTKDALVRIDMSEYNEKDAVLRLFGAPGYEDHGQLAVAVRRRPYCVVLLEEIEKAHRDVIDVISCLLGDGRMSDCLGRTVSFANSVVIMTSKVGSNLFQILGNEWDCDYDVVRRKVVELAAQTFRHEFMHRVDECIVFQLLDSKQISKIVENQLNHVKDRLKRKNITLHHTKEAIKLLAESGFNPKLGARLVKRTIQQLVENEIAMGLLKDDIKDGDSIILYQVLGAKDTSPSQNRLSVKKMKNVDMIVANG